MPVLVDWLLRSGLAMARWASWVRPLIQASNIYQLKRMKGNFTMVAKYAVPNLKGFCPRGTIPLPNLRGMVHTGLNPCTIELSHILRCKRD